MINQNGPVVHSRNMLQPLPNEAEGDTIATLSSAAHDAPDYIAITYLHESKKISELTVLFAALSTQRRCSCGASEELTLIITPIRFFSELKDEMTMTSLDALIGLNLAPS